MLRQGHQQTQLEIHLQVGIVASDPLLLDDGEGTPLQLLPAPMVVSRGCDTPLA